MESSNIGIKTFELAGRTVSLETGIIARQADAAVRVDIDGTVVLVTVVGVKEVSENLDFFPLIVNYQERAYASGKIPGGFFKREGRPSEREILVSRLIDRAIRPLFPKDFKHEVQVVITVLSVNPEVEPDIPSIIGTSAALAISGIPFHGPVGAARVGYVNGEYVLNPSEQQLLDSSLDLMLAGTADSILMVESEAKQLSEQVMIGALEFGQNAWQTMVRVIAEFKAEFAKPAWQWEAPLGCDETRARVENEAVVLLEAAYLIREKQKRQEVLKEARRKVLDIITEETAGDENKISLAKQYISKLESKIVRNRILNNEPRIDGRDTKTVRDIFVDSSILPRTHGSALFTRGETQALVVTTLGATGRDMQIVENFGAESKERFMLHYNFPPYCVGETGMVGAPKRREIGHGRLAKRGVQAVLPDEKEFPYVIRVVSEITESNGSSSMASVCGASLSLMDAGVPLKAPVAGIAMGLIKEADRYAVITDILGDEDHLGDMDFKVAGTENGITALQMDIKIEGITREIMEVALAQALDARLHILKIMSNSLSEAREEISDFAPRILSFNINPDKIRDVIGKGGATIKALSEEHDVTVEISDAGLVTISATDGDKGKAAKKAIELIVTDLEIGKIYDGKVVKIVDFGAFVNVLPGRDGLLHVSQLAEERVEDVSSVLSEGQLITVKVIDIDRQGRVKLSVIGLD